MLVFRYFCDEHISNIFCRSGLQLVNIRWSSWLVWISELVIFRLCILYKHSSSSSQCYFISLLSNLDIRMLQVPLCTISYCELQQHVSVMMWIKGETKKGRGKTCSPPLSLFLISIHPFSTLLLFNVTSHYFRPIMLPLPHYLPEAQKGLWGMIPWKTQGGMTPAPLKFLLSLRTLLNCLLFLYFWAVHSLYVCTLMTGVEKVGMHMLIKLWGCLYPNSYSCEVTHHSIMWHVAKAIVSLMTFSPVPSLSFPTKSHNSVAICG